MSDCRGPSKVSSSGDPSRPETRQGSPKGSRRTKVRGIQAGAPDTPPKQSATPLLSSGSREHPRGSVPAERRRDPGKRTQDSDEALRRGPTRSHRTAARTAGPSRRPLRSGKVSPRLVGALALVALIGTLAALFAPRVVTRLTSRPLPAPTPASPRPPAATPSTAAPSEPADFLRGRPEPILVDERRSYPDVRSVESRLRSDPRIESFRSAYTVSAVGEVQRPMQELVAERFPSTTGSKSPAECMNAVLRSVPRPLLPAYVERALVSDTDAWILLFVASTEGADVSGEGSLDSMLLYAMDRRDCTILATSFWSVSA